jgi:phage shock protein A
MNQLTRLWQALRGKTTALLDELEDPEEQLSVFVAELNEQVHTLHRSVASALADEKRLKMQIEDLLARAATWESRAVLALQQSNEALAREALLQKEDCEAQALALQKGWEAQKQATDTLKASLQAAKTRVEEAKTKYNLLLAQYKSATTRQKIQQSLAGTTDGSPLQMVERLADRICKIEAETEASLDLSGAVAPDLDARFLELERKQKGDAALELLRSRLATQKQLTDDSRRGTRIDELKAKLDKV